MSTDAELDGLSHTNLAEFISRFLPLHEEGNGVAGRCCFCSDDGNSLKIGSKGWRCGNCCEQEVTAPADAIGFYASWCQCSREEASAKLGNGAGLPDAQPIAQVPLRKLPFWGWRELEKQPDKAAWIHDLSGSVLVWRQLVPERAHLGIIQGRRWEQLGIVAPPRRVVLVPENNPTSRVKMQQLAAALYRAGHAQVMCLDLGVTEDGTRGLPGPSDEPLKWAKARSKPYPHPNAAPQDNKAITPPDGDGLSAP